MSYVDTLSSTKQVEAVRRSISFAIRGFFVYTDCVYFFQSNKCFKFFVSRKYFIFLIVQCFRGGQTRLLFFYFFGLVPCVDCILTYYIMNNNNLVYLLCLSVFVFFFNTSIEKIYPNFSKIHYSFISIFFYYNWKLKNKGTT